MISKETINKHYQEVSSITPTENLKLYWEQMFSRGHDAVYHEWCACTCNRTVPKEYIPT